MWNENIVVIVNYNKLKFSKKILLALQWDLITHIKIRL
jgi:hypothetical protein